MRYFRSITGGAALLALAITITRCGGDAAPKAEHSEAVSEDTVKVVKALPPGAVNNALPFTLKFVEKTYSSTLPALQSYIVASTSDGLWLIMGGRTQGLHTFKSAPDTNFLPAKSNNTMYLIDPVAGTALSFDVNQLPAPLSAPLQATNHQTYFDHATGMLYIVGGYGWKADKTNMVTFNSIIRLKVDDVAEALKKKATPAQMAALFTIDYDDRFAVTGGELFKMNSNFYLVFGQKFMGQYRAFGGTDFTQHYTEEMRVFTLLPNSLKIGSYGATTNNNADRPFHRRDGNTFEDVDPVTGQQRITAMGGVFKPGIIGAYDYPIYINSPATPQLNVNAKQKFSQYECPVITVYDSTGAKPTTYNNFFGGIGHYYYFQTAPQTAVYNIATGEGRNDGFPFVADISTFLEASDGTYSEYIHTEPVPRNRLLGAAASFILSPAVRNAGYTFDNGVIKLAKLAKGQDLLLGYVYGGIEAENPLPIHPNTGTFTSNTIFEVHLIYMPSAAIPAANGHESVVHNENIQRK